MIPVVTNVFINKKKTIIKKLTFIINTKQVQIIICLFFLEVDAISR
jgi:hypothetical protein